MKKIEYDEDTISILMLGVGAFSELDENGTAGKHPDFIQLMASSITTGLAGAFAFFDIENPDELELMRQLLAFIAGNPVIERIFDLVEKKLDEQFDDVVSKKINEFIKDVVEDSENGCKPS